MRCEDGSQYSIRYVCNTIVVVVVIIILIIIIIIILITIIITIIILIILLLILIIIILKIITIIIIIITTMMTMIGNFYIALFSDLQKLTALYNFFNHGHLSGNDYIRTIVALNEH